ncbi:MAG: glycosyltransferase family 2 protein [Paracoccaceae bacterium]|jgi:dolichol-phosphate mannosyltransferase
MSEQSVQKSLSRHHETTDQDTDLLFSIVVPVKNEGANVDMLLGLIDSACDGRLFEAIFVDDGSTDDTCVKLQAALTRYDWLRVLNHAQSGGQSAAVHSGVLCAKASRICTIDGDGQNPPSEIPRLIDAMDSQNGSKVHLVAGQRVMRNDTLSKRVASRIANTIRQAILKDSTRDTGCGHKAFDRGMFLELPYFNNMHRYLPALFSAYGGRVIHIDVAHEPRKAGNSNYNNFQRGLVGIYDLIGVSWLIKRHKRVRPTEVRAHN